MNDIMVASVAQKAIIHPMCLQVRGIRLEPRSGHSATSFNISEEITEVIIFGGVSELLQTTYILRFGESTLEGIFLQESATFLYCSVYACVYRAYIKCIACA